MNMQSKLSLMVAALGLAIAPATSFGLVHWGSVANGIDVDYAGSTLTFTNWTFNGVNQLGPGGLTLTGLTGLTGLANESGSVNGSLLYTGGSLTVNFLPGNTFTSNLNLAVNGGSFSSIGYTADWALGGTASGQVLSSSYNAGLGELTNGGTNTVGLNTYGFSQLAIGADLDAFAIVDPSPATATAFAYDFTSTANTPDPYVSISTSLVRSELPAPSAIPEPLSAGLAISGLLALAGHVTMRRASR